MATVDSRSMGVTLLILYILVANNPLKRFANIAQAVDPTSELEVHGFPQWGGWQGRTKNFVENGAQLVFLLTVVKTTGLLPYPGSDQAWLFVASVFVVAAAVGKVWTDKAFWTEKLMKAPDGYGLYAYDVIVRLLNDFGDLAILVLLASLTVYKKLNVRGLHIGILIFLGILLVMGILRDWFGVIGKDLDTDKPWRNPTSVIAHPSGAEDGYPTKLKMGVVYNFIDWFFNQTGDMLDMWSPAQFLESFEASLDSEDGTRKIDASNTADFVFASVLSHQSSYIFSRLLLVLAIMSLFKQKF